MSPKKKDDSPIPEPPYGQGILPNLFYLIGFRPKPFIIVVITITLCAVLIILVATTRINYQDENVNFQKEKTSMQELKGNDKSRSNK